jgi:pimeloyl-ACP methyl ester carboxylesterase
MAPPPERRHVVVDGMRMRYVDAGPTEMDEPDATLLVIPGHTARLEGFDQMLPALSARHRVLVPDMPGSGYSDKPDREYTLPFYEDVLAAFLDALGVGEAVPVGGSLGGNLVLRLGHRWPERFRRLVLWAPGGAWRARPAVAAVVRRVPRRLMFWPTVRIQSRYWYHPDHPGRQQALDETFAYYREVMGPGFLRMYWGVVVGLLDNSLFDIAPEIRQPTLLMWGDQDDGGGMRAGVAKLHRLLPDNELHVFPGRRHSLEAEIPDELASTILEWLERDR